MSEHVYYKEELIQKFDQILDKTFGQIDKVGVFEHVYEEGFKSQKGIAGSIIEQSVLGYPPDTRQEADLVVIENGERKDTELKVTGMRISKKGGLHFVAKEPITITAVSIYDLVGQEFETSHFWNKLEHMLIVYYHYLANHAVTPYEYKDFPVKDYEFHEFSQEDKKTLDSDWSYVHDLIADIEKKYTELEGEEWKQAVKQEYLDRHGELRRYLSYINLAPKFPPRFRLKKSVVNTMIAKHFEYKLEQLSGSYITISDVDKKCQEIQSQYSGKTIGEIADQLGVPKITKSGKENKSIAEQITVKMFGGNAKKLNKIELFERYGLIAKSIALTPDGGRTEDMKLYHIDFEEMLQESITEEDGTVRPFTFEDSELYEYFADHEFLCIIYREPAEEYIFNPQKDKKVKVKHPLVMNKFLGFQRLVFSDEFIDTVVKKVWDDTRNKIKNNLLVDVINKKADGSLIHVSSGDISSTPNFIKGTENEVFIRGSSQNSAQINKTECVNGIVMLPQYIWIKGTAVCKELSLHSEDYKS